MSWESLNNLLARMFNEINEGQGLRSQVMSPRMVWGRYQQEIDDLLETDCRDEFVNLGDGIWLPRAFEAIRVLGNLRQRFSSDANPAGRDLVEQVRAESLIRYRPVWDVNPASFNEEQQRFAQIADKPTYSRFQVAGWRKVMSAIENRRGIIITAPTGAGKTEVFLMPIIFDIAKNLASNNVPRFILIYPRVELLKDQLSRVLEYAHRASNIYSPKDLLGGTQHYVTVGVQYRDVKASFQDTCANPRIFDPDDVFVPVSKCPVCRTGNLHRPSHKRAIRTGGKQCLAYLQCDHCQREYPVTLSRDDLLEAKPHILLTTLESLNELSLHPKFDPYLSQLTGLTFDEIHLFNSIYGAHVSQVIRRIEEMQSNRMPLVKIGASATVSRPEVFGHRLFHGSDGEVDVHSPGAFPQEAAGLENVIFLRAPDPEVGPPSQSTLIQTAMATGHAILERGERAIVFTDSVDNASRIMYQVLNAEGNRRLWEFRTIPSRIRFEGSMCSNCVPAICPIYEAGECWRGIICGENCNNNISQIRQGPLSVESVSSFSPNDFRHDDLIVSTAALEVGVDDDSFKATVHYRPPYSVFSFLQRRGRAGRRRNESAQTVLVLGRTASDEFYFRRRHRLLSNDFEIPLNPQNAVVMQMHNQFQAEREAIHSLYKKTRNWPKALFAWMLNKYRQCNTLRLVFGSELAGFGNNHNIQQNQKEFRDWIKKHHSNFENYLNLRLLAQELVERMPEGHRDNAERFRSAIDDFIRGDTSQVNNIQTLASELYRGLSELENASFEAHDEVEREDFLNLKSQVHNITQSINQIVQIAVDPGNVTSLYHFFTLLNEKLINSDYGDRTLNYVPGMIRIVMQSLFFVGSICLHEDTHCPVCLDFYVPDTYFREVKPITVETWTASQQRPQELHVEDSTKLATMLIPYKPFFRYFTNDNAQGGQRIPFMATVRTEHRSDWVDRSINPPKVRLRLLSEGIGEGELHPRKIYVRPVASDEDGQGVVKLCENCFAIHNLNRTRNCQCDGRIRPVRLYSTPIVERFAQNYTLEKISRTFYYCYQLIGTTRILGADVDYRYVHQENDGSYRSVGDSQPFEARYISSRNEPQPIAYSIATRGIRWDLSTIVDRVLQDENIRQKLTEFDKDLSRELILHTAAHMLHKAVASLSGVGDHVIEYAVISEQNSIMVWERYEGGIGISEVIRDIILGSGADDPTVKLYRELLSSALCPVFLAQQSGWQNLDQLRGQLSDTWGLPEDDELIISIASEAVAERHAVQQHHAEQEDACIDGCPTCIHTTQCVARRLQEQSVSRLVAEVIMQSFILTQITSTNLDKIREYCADNNLPQPSISNIHEEEDLFDVVQF